MPAERQVRAHHENRAGRVPDRAQVPRAAERCPVDGGRQWTGGPSGLPGGDENPPPVQRLLAVPLQRSVRRRHVGLVTWVRSPGLGHVWKVTGLGLRCRRIALY